MTLLCHGGCNAANDRLDSRCEMQYIVTGFIASILVVRMERLQSITAYIYEVKLVQQVLLNRNLVSCEHDYFKGSLW